MKELCRPMEGVIAVDSALPPTEVLERVLNYMLISKDTAPTTK